MKYRTIINTCGNAVYCIRLYTVLCDVIFFYMAERCTFLRSSVQYKAMLSLDRTGFTIHPPRGQMVECS